MRVSILLSLIPLALAIATPEDTKAPFEVAAPIEEAALEARDLEPLDKRACTGSCKCVSGLRQGQYCGACKWKGNYVITSGRVLNHVYECSPSGACCSYGKGSDCNTGSGRCGPY